MSNLFITVAAVLLLTSRAVSEAVNVLPPKAVSDVDNPVDAAHAVFHAFEVYPPVLTVNQSGLLVATNSAPNVTQKFVSSSFKPCLQTLVAHSYAYSLGDPYVVPYEPPSCSFNHVTWNLTVTTSGVQYDRQGTVSFGNTELFRTTTVEPDKGQTEWTYLKDMKPFISLFKHNNTLIFDLPNVVEGDINGDYNVTLTASYFDLPSSYEPADQIFSVSQDLGSQGQPSYFTFPQQNASSEITLPQNIARAVYTVVAVGQASEEFWWDAVLNSELDALAASATDQFSPFREVQLFIDSQLAGVAWPMPILFSGADDPLYWRPIAGIDILDLKEYEIDITPWLPLLCDGRAHTFDMRVSGLNDTEGNGTATLSETTLDDWYLGGKVFVWLDEEGHVTTGDGPHRTGAAHFDVSSEITKNKKGENNSLFFEVEARRELAFHSTLKLSTGTEKVFWSQSLDFSASGNYTYQGFVSVRQQLTKGYEVSSSGYARQFSYPFLVNATPNGVEFLRSKDVTILGQSVFPTGLETFYPNQTAKGCSQALTQAVTALGSELVASTNLSLSAFDVNSAPKPDAPASMKGLESLFKQSASAVQAELVSDVAEFLLQPQV